MYRKTAQIVQRIPMYSSLLTYPWDVCQNERIDVGTILLTKLQTLFVFHQFFP